MYYYKEENESEFKEISIEEIIEGINNNKLDENSFYYDIGFSEPEKRNISLYSIMKNDLMIINKFKLPFRLYFWFTNLKTSHNPIKFFNDMLDISDRGKISIICNVASGNYKNWDKLGLEDLGEIKDIVEKSIRLLEMTKKDIANKDIKEKAKEGIDECNKTLSLIVDIEKMKEKLKSNE